MAKKLGKEGYLGKVRIKDGFINREDVETRIKQKIPAFAVYTFDYSTGPNKVFVTAKEKEEDKFVHVFLFWFEYPVAIN